MPSNRQSGALMAATLAGLVALAWLIRPRPAPPLPPRRTRDSIELPRDSRAAPTSPSAAPNRSPTGLVIDSASFDVRLPTAAPTDVPASARTPLGAEGDIRPPELVHRVEPPYPEALRRERIEGTVVLEAVVTESGEVSNLRVVRSTRPELEEPALSAVREWRYRPATFQGRPVRVYLTITTNFRLRE
jgi:protein TonB